MIIKNLIKETNLPEISRAANEATKKKKENLFSPLTNVNKTVQAHFVLLLNVFTVCGSICLLTQLSFNISLTAS